MRTVEGGTQRERTAMVAWAAGLGAVSAQALARLDGGGVRSARSRLAAAERAGLLASRQLLRDQPRLYTVTREGLRRCGAHELSPARVSAAGARHSALCSEVAAELQRSFPGHRLLGEPALRAEQRRDGVPLASVELRGVGAGAELHRPDLVLLDGSGDGSPLAVEVELTVKAPRRLRAICRAWARSGRLAGVLYVVAADAEGPLRRAIESVNAGRRIALLGIEELLGPLDATPFAENRRKHGVG